MRIEKHAYQKVWETSWQKNLTILNYEGSSKMHSTRLKAQEVIKNSILLLVETSNGNWVFENSSFYLTFFTNHEKRRNARPHQKPC